jgi:peptide/nickel transport system substrate-binding protein
VVASTDPQTGTVLQRNPHWSRATDPVRTALPDRVVVRSGLSGLERDQALLAGSGDIDVSGTGVQALTTARLTGDAVAGRVDDVTTGAVRVLALPTTVAPMDNPACRAAVAQAVDRQALQDALGGDDDAVVTTQLWPRALAGGPEGGAGAPDPAAARRSLAACGKPGGFSTVLAVSDSPATVQLARAVAGQLAAVGIRADVRPLDATSFYATDVGKPDVVTKNGYGIVLASYTADFPTAGSFLAPLVDGRSIRSVGNTDWAHLDDKDVDALVDKARAGGGVAAWRAVAVAAARTNAYVPLTETRVQLVAGQRLRNGVVMQPYGGYDVATAGIR